MRKIFTLMLLAVISATTAFGQATLTQVWSQTYSWNTASAARDLDYYDGYIYVIDKAAKKVRAIDALTGLEVLANDKANDACSGFNVAIDDSGNMMLGTVAWGMTGGLDVLGIYGSTYTDYGKMAATGLGRIDFFDAIGDFSSANGGWIAGGTLTGELALFQVKNQLFESAGAPVYRYTGLYSGTVGVDVCYVNENELWISAQGGKPVRVTLSADKATATSEVLETVALDAGGISVFEYQGVEYVVHATSVGGELQIYDVTDMENPVAMLANPTNTLNSSAVVKHIGLATVVGTDGVMIYAHGVDGNTSAYKFEMPAPIVEKGTQENPYSVAEVIALGNPGTEDVWVQGFIIGSNNNGSIGASDYNIVLASTNTVVSSFDAAAHVTVQLSGDLRGDIGLTTNPSNVGRQVKVKGDLLAYFNNVGVKNTTDYEFIVDDLTYVAAPLFDVAEGRFTEVFNLTITSATAGATIYYTLDGTTPNSTSAEYTAPVSIPAATTTVKAIAINGTYSSDVTEVTYTYVAPFVGDKVEDFTNASLSGSYGNGSFVGNYGITWTYVESRDEDNTAGVSGKAIMLRRSADDSKVTSSTIAGGIGHFSVKMYKGFTGGGNRQVEVFINGTSIGTSEAFDDTDEHTFIVNNVNVEGDFTIEIKNLTSKQVIVDDITWTQYGSVAPTVIAAPVFSVEAGQVDSAFKLAIKTETEGASIFYSIDGTNPSVAYTDSLDITATTTVKAVAVLGVDSSDIVEATYTLVVELGMTEVADFDAFETLADTENNVKIIGEMTAVFQNYQSLYVYDGTDIELIYGGKVLNGGYTLVNGQAISNVVGKFQEHNDASQMVLDTIETVGAVGTAVAPVVSVPADLTAADINQYVRFENVEMDADVTYESGAVQNGTIVVGEGTMTICNQFRTIDAMFTEGDMVDVEGFVSVYSGKVQLYVTSIELNSGSATGLEANEGDSYVVYARNSSVVVEAEAGVEIQAYTVAGVCVYNAEATGMATVLENMPQGVLMVKVGAKVSKVVVK